MYIYRQNGRDRRTNQCYIKISTPQPHQLEIRIRKKNRKRLIWLYIPRSKYYHTRKSCDQI